MQRKVLFIFAASKLLIKSIKEEFIMSKIFQQKKRPPDMDVILPRDKNLSVSKSTINILVDGENEFRKGNYETALAIYKKVSRNDIKYWEIRVNEMLCEIRLEHYNSALSIFDNIKENCKDNNKYVAQAYINKGDCLIGMSVIESNNELEKKAYDNYHEAYKIDSSSIASVFHFWFAESARGNYRNAEVLRSIINRHKDYKTLSQEQVRYFVENNEPKKIKFFKENFIMSWKKLVLVGLYLIIFSMVVLAENLGVLNGGNKLF
jgi:tetratricopeptide (TPR) repeat protein